MLKYQINKIENSEYVMLVTLLDYEQNISNTLKKIKLTDSIDKTIIVDTALVSGINQFRFIKINIDKNDNLDLNSLKYVNPNHNIINLSNKLLSKFEKQVQNSVLSSNQVDIILNNN